MKQQGGALNPHTLGDLENRSLVGFRVSYPHRHIFPTDLCLRFIYNMCQCTIRIHLYFSLPKACHPPRDLCLRVPSIFLLLCDGHTGEREDWGQTAFSLSGFHLTHLRRGVGRSCITKTFGLQLSLQGLLSTAESVHFDDLGPSPRTTHIRKASVPV